MGAGGMNQRLRDRPNLRAQFCFVHLFLTEIALTAQWVIDEL